MQHDSAFERFTIVLSNARDKLTLLKSWYPLPLTVILAARTNEVKDPRAQRSDRRWTLGSCALAALLKHSLWQVILHFVRCCGIAYVPGTMLLAIPAQHASRRQLRCRALRVAQNHG